MQKKENISNMSHIQQISSSACNDLNVDAREIVVGFDSFPKLFPFLLLPSSD